MDNSSLPPKLRWRTVKVSDLLRSPWTRDTIFFENKNIEIGFSLVSEGITGEIILLALNNNALEVTLQNIECKVVDISDISWEEFVRDIYIDTYAALFELPHINKKWKDDWESEYENSYEDIYNINEKDLTINLEEFIANAIKSQEPLVKRSYDETLLDWWEIDEYI